MSAEVQRIATESAHMAQRLASNLLLATQPEPRRSTVSTA